MSISFSATFDLSTINGSNGFRLDGIDSYDESGVSVSGAGDVNGDGIDDIIIGSLANSGGNTRAGETYVVFGTSSGFSASFDLSTLNGSNGFRLDGIDAEDRSGRSVSGAGDLNGDGIDDIIIGAPQADPGGDSRAGETYVVFGTSSGFSASLDLSTLNGSNGFRLDGIDVIDFSGLSVSGAGDVNGDGIDDAIIGAYGGKQGDNFRAGETYVLFGTSTGFSASLDLSTLNGSNGFKLNGIDAEDRSGWSVSGAGDVNGDGVDDIIIGAYLADQTGDTNAGETYVVFGSSSGFSASFELSSINGTNGFRLDGIDAEDQSGRAVSGAGDVNGDGIDDIIIGAREADPGGESNAGETYVVFGSSTGFSTSLDLSTLNGTNGFRLNGIAAGDISGTSVSNAGDVNGDGIDDIIIGAHDADPGGDSSAGATYVVFGSSSGFSASFDLTGLNGSNGFRLDGIDVDDRSGWSVSAAGDVNGDGVDDIIIGTDAGDPDGHYNAGETYVVFGNAPPVFTSSDTAMVDEGTTTVMTVIANDSSPGGTLGYSISGGDDQALFAIDAGTGELSFLDSPDYDNPGDAGANNIYEVEITATDGVGGSDTQMISVTVDEVNLNPTMTSPATASVDENTTAVMTVTASDPDAGDIPVFSISGGADQAMFGIDTNSGALSFLAAPDFENPGDAGANNVYEVEVTASDGNGGSDAQLISVTVDNVSGNFIGTPDMDVFNGSVEEDMVTYGGSSGVTVRLWNGTGERGDAEGDTYTMVESVTGTDFSDILIGTFGEANILNGQAGDDFLFGLTGDDVISGGLGDDFLVGGAGADNLDGGAGSDTVSYMNSQSVFVRLWNGTASDGDALASIENVIGSSHDDAIIGSNMVDNIIEGGGGADYINGLGGDDTVSYQGSSNGVVVRLWNGTGSSGDAEGDVLVDIENVTGSNHNDAIIGSNMVDNFIEGGGGADYINGLGGNNAASYKHSETGVTVRLWNGTGTGGDAEGDTLVNIVNVRGSEFGDTLLGSFGTDNILFGGGGGDHLFGLSGNDTFMFSDNFGNDVIHDFADGSEFMDMTESSLSAADLRIEVVGADTIVHFDQVDATITDTITIEGVAAGIDAGDFIF